MSSLVRRSTGVTRFFCPQYSANLFQLRLASSSSQLLARSKVPLAEQPYDYNAVLTKQLKRRRWKDLRFRLGFNPRAAQDKRKSIVVLGTGWGAMNFIRHLDVTYYDVTIVSPRNFFTFTPLLPAVSAGTLSPRSCLEPVRPKLLRGGKRMMDFYEAWATTLDSTTKEVTCQSKTGEQFKLPYDYLVVAVGAETNTFGTPGVLDNALFLKEVENAREIRRRILNNFEHATLPGVPEHIKKRLLHFVIIGGGPTGVETAAEVSDFIREDATKHYPNLVQYSKISLVEMLPRLLPMFSPEASNFTQSNLGNMGVRILTETRVLEITPTSIIVEDKAKAKQEFECGFVLWASGVGQVPFSQKILQTLPEQKDNRVLRVDENLRVHGGAPFIYGIGDCTLFTPEPLHRHSDWLYEVASQSKTGAGTTWLKAEREQLGTRFPQLYPLPPALELPNDHMTKEDFVTLLRDIDSNFRPPPPTAQNANQEARYLASVFNQYIQQKDKDNAPAYVYHSKGVMAYVGNRQSVLQLPKTLRMGGSLTNLIWKAFYLSQQMSRTNQFMCVFDWYRARFVGRDTGRDHTLDGIPPPPNN